MPLRDGASALGFFLGPDHPGGVSEGRYLPILLDLNLPDMTRIEILEQAKGDARTRHLAMVILTTIDDEGEIKRCYDLGANVYITKPVEYDSFTDAIRQLGLFFSVMQVP